MVANLAAERRSLTAQVWRFVLEELKTDLAAFKTAKDGLNKAMSSINDQIAKAIQEKDQRTAEIRSLEKQTTSIQPTINGINTLLSSFGFYAFLLAEAANGASGHIKQVFVLTHNVYLNREITFNPTRSNDQTMNEETFWVVRKAGTVSKLDGHSTNPIKTSYDLLWSEVRNPDRSSLTIQNTLGRSLYIDQ